MLHSGLCLIQGYVVRYYVVRDYVAFGIMLLGIMSHSALCCIRTYVVGDCVVWCNVVWVNVVRRSVVRPTVCVSSTHHLSLRSSHSQCIYMYKTLHEFNFRTLFKQVYQVHQEYILRPNLKIKVKNLLILSL